MREPEVIFWVFVFPLLLALGLGIAFRNKPADTAPRGRGRRAARRKDDGPAATGIRPAPPSGYGSRARPRALKAFRLGKYDLVIEPNPDGSYHLPLRSGPARRACWRAPGARRCAAGSGRAQERAGRPRPQASSEPGSRYIDFLIPGLLGMNLMNSGMWGIGFALVEMRQRKLLKRFVATPMRRSDFLLALTSSRLVLMVVELGPAAGVRRARLSHAHAGLVLTILLLSALGALCLRRPRPADAPAARRKSRPSAG